LRRLDYAELKGEGNKILEFTRAFLNIMASTNVKITEIPCASNEIIIKITTSHFTKGKFHAINDKGDLYYKAYIKDDNAKYWGIAGILVLIAGIIFLVSTVILGGMNFIVGIVCGAIIFGWLGYGSYLSQYGDEPEKVLVHKALSSAAAEIRVL